MKRGHHYEISGAVLAIIAVAIVAIEFFQVRELLAELLLFSVLFGVLGMALFTLYLIQEVVLKGAARIESCVAYVRARHSGVLGHLGKDHVLRSSRWH